MVTLSTTSPNKSHAVKGSKVSLLGHAEHIASGMCGCSGSVVNILGSGPSAFRVRTLSCRRHYELVLLKGLANVDVVLNLFGRKWMQPHDNMCEMAWPVQAY